MALRIGSQIGINRSYLPEPEEDKVPQESSQTVQEAQISKNSIVAGPSVRAESRMIADLQQALLNQQLSKSGETLPVRPGPGPASLLPNKWEASQKISYGEILENRKEALNTPLLPKTLSTGSGNDRVNIWMGTDGLVHVNVNDKEAWVGTPKQFESITIDTGEGNDFISNTVAGAKIFAGGGSDEINNYASGATIDGGSASDRVSSYGNNNHFTEDGSDWIRTHGDYNEVKPSEVANFGPKTVVESYGDHNVIQTGNGMDHVKSTGNYNQIDTGNYRDEIEVVGDLNDVYGGAHPDEIHVEGFNNRIHLGQGEDTVDAEGGSAFIIGEGKP